MEVKLFGAKLIQVVMLLFGAKAILSGLLSFVLVQTLPVQDLWIAQDTIFWISNAVVALALLYLLKSHLALALQIAVLTLFECKIDRQVCLAARAFFRFRKRVCLPFQLPATNNFRRNVI